jgi:vacuolar-type H+-ATPase subunit H
MREVQAWAADLQEEVLAQVDKMRAENHFLIPDMDTIDVHVARTAAEYFNVGRTMVRMARLEWEAERNIARVNRESKREIAKARAQARRDIRSNVAFIRSQEPSSLKPSERYSLSVDDMDAEIELDPEVNRVTDLGERRIKNAENQFADIYENRKGLEIMLESLTRKCNVLPGLQGHANTTRKRQ